MPDLTANSVLQGVNSFTNANLSGNSATLSMSFGECDNQSTSYDNSLYQETNTARSKGQTILASTGDNGAKQCPSGAEVPASDPLVVGVGGTSPDTQYSVVWQGGPQGQYGWVGSGGGISYYYGKPPYQSGIGACNMRCLPDIALPADPFGGLIIYCSSGCTYEGKNLSGFFPVGGTSLASPLAASAFAEMSQEKNTTIGFAGNVLYAGYPNYSSGEIIDITAGNNGTPAGPDWDGVTGLGTPDWNLLSNAF
jgi:subtilase family serine protease